MADVNVRSDSVDVEQIMRQIRARVREKRGADYTEAELQQLAKVKLEKFLDPKWRPVRPAGAVPIAANGEPVAAELRVRARTRCTKRTAAAWPRFVGCCGRC